MKPKKTKLNLDYSIVKTYSDDLKHDGYFFMIKNLSGFVNIQRISFN